VVDDSLTARTVSMMQIDDPSDSAAFTLRMDQYYLPVFHYFQRLVHTRSDPSRPLFVGVSAPQVYNRNDTNTYLSIPIL
jgi:hypothetical protein